MLYVNFRTAGVGGSIAKPPYVLETKASTSGIVVENVAHHLPPGRVRGKHVVFATHGFNVSFADGLRSLTSLETDIISATGGASSPFLVVGVLWPGDYWLPVVNYPAEASDAAECGAVLADVAAKLRGQTDISFVSHSLGGRLVLEAVQHLPGTAEVCLMAAAVDDNCLFTTQYEAARRNARRISVLSSTRDVVLALAYPVGDLVSDLWYDTDAATRPALGRYGPSENAPNVVDTPSCGFGHGDYLRTNWTSSPAPKPKSAAQYAAESLSGSRHTWPT